MNDWVGLIIVIVVILVIWWLLTRFAKQGPEAFEIHHEEEHTKAHVVETPAKAAAQPVQAPVRAAPVPLETPASAAPLPPEKAPEKLPDDLLIIEGIGPKVNRVLQAQGITTFAGLAAADPAVIKKWLSENGMGYMDPGTWPQQAGLLAAGKMEEFQKLVDSLKGGRKK